MGIKAPTKDFERQSLEAGGLDFPGLKWCELGNQKIDRKPAKHVYLSRGVAEHVSIDLNGKDGAMPLDLDHPVPFIFRGQFDVVTNFGTTEHVNDQYHAFKNTHDMCRMGGLMIHIVPRNGNWPRHCRYYYTPEFVDSLAAACGYEIVHRGVLDTGIYAEPKNLVAFTFRKTREEFVPADRFARVEGLVDSGELDRTGDYNKRTLRHKLRSIKAILLEK